MRATENDASVDTKRGPASFTWAVGGALSAVLLGVTFRGVDTHRVSALLRGIGWGAPLLLLPSLLALLFETRAWQYALFLAGQPTRLLALFGVRVGSESVGAVLPLGAVWADALKPALLRRRCGVPLPAGLAAIAMRKYLLVTSQAAYLVVAFFAGGRALRDGFEHALGAPWLYFFALIAAAALGGIGTSMAAVLGRGSAFRTLFDRLCRIRWEPLRRHLSSLRAAALGMDDAASAFFGTGFRLRARPLLACLAAWLLEATETWLVLEAVGASLHWGDAVGVEALVVLSRHLLPFLPGGLGVQELGYAALFAGVGCDADRVMSLVVLKRVREAVWVAVGAVALSGFAALAKPLSAPSRVTAAA